MRAITFLEAPRRGCCNLTVKEDAPRTMSSTCPPFTGGGSSSMVRTRVGPSTMEAPLRNPISASSQKTPVPSGPAIEAAGHTHPGRQRRRNEDAFLVQTDLGLFVV